MANRAHADGMPEGIAIRIRPHNIPGAERSGRVFPGPLWWGLFLAAAFYLGAHLSIVWGVWPVHGTSRGAGATFVRDLTALVAWLLLFALLRRMRYRGSWPVLVLPVVVFCLARPALFQAFTDPAYQAPPGRKAEANDLKATRSRLNTIARAYSAERQELVFQGRRPVTPDPFAEVTHGQGSSHSFASRVSTYLPVFIAPFAVLIGFLVTRAGWVLRWFRDHRLWMFAPGMVLFFGLAVMADRSGKVAGTTPWELLLPFFVAIWAATLADDVYNLAQPGEAMQPQRLARLALFGAMPLVPFLMIHELGLSVTLALSLAAMLLVGTRRGWWAGLMGVLWIGLVTAAFNLDPRSIQRLGLAYDPYRDLTTMSADQAQRWGERANFQIKLFDANVLEGDLLGDGAGRGHGETAPNAADDGYITLFAAQWGLLGGLALVLVYTVFLIQLLGVALREPGAFERTLVTGLVMLIAVPFWLSTLGGVRVIPLTGVVAAFAAHGGSKLLAAAFSVGAIAGISHRRAVEQRLEQALDAPEGEASTAGVRIV